jgi:hypothetical protein
MQTEHDDVETAGAFKPLRVNGCEGMKHRKKMIPPEAAMRVPEVLDRLIELYTATKKREDVEKWSTERAKYPAAAAPSESTK